jgi:hypothetical protein
VLGLARRRAVFDGRSRLMRRYPTADTFDRMPTPLSEMDAARIAAREQRAGLLAGAALAVIALAVTAFALFALVDAPAAGQRAPEPIVTSTPQTPATPFRFARRDDTPARGTGTGRAAASATPASAPGSRIDRIPMTTNSASLFMPLYRRASQTFGVNWRLIASIHQQETSFSSAPGTYRGLNFAGCCAGPMQFNVTNGPVTTWERFRDAYRGAERPAWYPHRTRRHPSVYDDFDAIMAAGALLQANGAGRSLDGAAWLASYHYYGHDFTGLQYANQVLARAVGWSRAGLCVECAVDARLAARFDASFAAPYRAELVVAERRARAAARETARARARAKRAVRERARRTRAARRWSAQLEADRRARAREDPATKANAGADKASKSRRGAASAPAPAAHTTTTTTTTQTKRKSAAPSHPTPAPPTTPPVPPAAAAASAAGG